MLILGQSGCGLFVGFVLVMGGDDRFFGLRGLRFLTICQEGSMILIVC